MRARRKLVVAAAVAACSLALVVAVAALVSAVLVQEVDVAGYASPEPYEIVAIGVFLLVSPVLGAVLAARFPRNPIGWLFMIVPAALAVGFAADGYSMWARHVAGDEGPAPAVAFVLGGTVSGLGFGGIALIALLFPTGTLPSKRWRAVSWLVVVAQLALASQALQADTSNPGLVNPFAVTELVGVLDALEFGGVIGTICAVLAGAAALALRFRRARNVERQQLKWFAYAVGLTAALLLFATLLPVPIADAFWIAAICSLSLWSIAACIAILRYRLYDIEVIIRRTLIYGSVLAALAAAYLGGVVLVQSVLRTFTSGSEIAVAASTLLTVALFQPLRSRVQQAVDRRFYRSRYDASRTIDAFAEELRDEVDLESVRAHLLDAVGETMSPAHASVWLRERAR